MCHAFARPMSAKHLPAEFFASSRQFGQCRPPAPNTNGPFLFSPRQVVIQLHNCLYMHLLLIIIMYSIYDLHLILAFICIIGLLEELLGRLGPLY